jgi:hypothetical protein
MHGDDFVLDERSSTCPVRSRDALDSDDLDALLSLVDPLQEAVSAGSWTGMLLCPLLAAHDDSDLRLESRERVLAENLGSLARVTERFITRLGERSELLPVARVKRPARRALERLAGHTEDWAARDLTGPIARRALAVTREEDADLYENRMAVELIHPIMSAALAARIRRLGRVKADLADLERARYEGTHARLKRLYEYWGDDAAKAAESSHQATETLRRLEALAASVQQLRGNKLPNLLRGKRTGQRTLRRTNVIENDRHYRAVGQLWNEYKREATASESPAEREVRLQDRHRTFSHYVLGLLIRAMDDLSYSQAEDALPERDSRVVLPGPWGQARLGVASDGSISVHAERRTTRFVPLLDLLDVDDSPEIVHQRWTSIISDAETPTVVIYLAPSKTASTLPAILSTQLLSAGPDGPDGGPLVCAIPVSPLETTSLERVARAAGRALLEPALEAYPPQITLAAGDPLPRRLIDGLANAGLERPGASPLFHRADQSQIFLRRPLVGSERAALDQYLRSLTDRTKSPGWERDLAREILVLAEAVTEAELKVTPLLTCPSCRLAAQPGDVGRAGDLFWLSCRSCDTRWGHHRCGNCQGRVPVLATTQDLVSPEVTGPGWVERIFGQEALTSPCWARSSPSRYICPACGTCAVAGSSEGRLCPRCQGWE